MSARSFVVRALKEPSANETKTWHDRGRDALPRGRSRRPRTRRIERITGWQETDSAGGVVSAVEMNYAVDDPDDHEPVVLNRPLDDRKLIRQAES